MYNVYSNHLKNANKRGLPKWNKSFLQWTFSTNVSHKVLASTTLWIIFPFMNLQDLFLSSFEDTGNFANTKSFKLLSLALSRLFFWCEPSVLLLASSSLMKKKGSNFKAHKCLSFSFSSVWLTLFTLLGFTHVLISSSPTLCGVLSSFWQAGLIPWYSHSLFRVSRLIVARSWAWPFSESSVTLSVVIGTNNVGCGLNSGSELVKKAKSHLTFSWHINRNKTICLYSYFVRNWN